MRQLYIAEIQTQVTEMKDTMLTIEVPAGEIELYS